MTDTAATDLAARVATLEQRLAMLGGPGLEPLAAAPPITIGELADVPAPGSPIASQWGQEVSGRVLQRFATITERTSKWPAAAGNKGAMSIVHSDPSQQGMRVAMSDGAAWSPLQDWGAPRGHAGLVFTTGSQSGIGTGVTALSGLSLSWTQVAARRYRIMYAVQFLSANACTVDCLLMDVGAGTQLQKVSNTLTIASAFGSCNGLLIYDVAPGAGAAKVFRLDAKTTSGTVSTSHAPGQPAFLVIEDIGASA